nr:MAG TPA: putative metal-binding protein [Caudoviricetes sp.]
METRSRRKKKAYKWNFKQQKFELVGINENCITKSHKCSQPVCVQCGKLLGIVDYWSSIQYYDEEANSYFVCLDCYYMEQGEKEKTIKEIKLNKFKEIKERNKNESKN